MGKRFGQWLVNWRYALVLAIVYFVVFPLTVFTGPKGLLIAGLLLVLPLTHLALGVVSGYRHRRFPWLLLVASAALFFPAMLIVLNQTAWPYLPFYYILLALGYGLGRGIHWLTIRVNNLETETA